MKLWDDLAAARAEMAHPKMSAVGRAGKNGARTYPYATLKDVIDAIVPPLSKRGVWLTQRIDAGTLVTEAFKGDEAAELDRRPVDLSGTSQEQGSAETYAKRYALCSVFCLAGTEDDDGKAASERPAAAKQREEPVTAKQKAAEKPKAPDPLEEARARLVKAERAYAEAHGMEFEQVHSGTMKRPEYDGNVPEILLLIAQEFEDALEGR